MGYRARLGRIAKTEKVRFAEKTYEEVERMLPEDSACYRPDSHIELYELGKYYDFTRGTLPFYDFDIYEKCECEFCIMEKEELKELICEYHNVIYETYEKLAKGLMPVQRFIEGRARTWCAKFFDPYYLDEKKTDGEIVRSWEYEYAIFNLVYIYRTFDWKNDYLIYSAW